jgi:hypothetical protein
MRKAIGSLEMQSPNDAVESGISEHDLYQMQKEWKNHIDARRKETIKILKSKCSANRKICAIGNQLGLSNSETRLLEFLCLVDYVNEPEVFWCAFYQAWVSCDATWSLRFRLRATLRKWKRASLSGGPCTYLSSSAAAFFHALPESIHIYRGARMQHIKGLAWTTDHKVARGFARGHRGIGVPNAVIAQALIRKDHIFFATNSREESEVAVDFDHLTKVRFDRLGW